MLLLSNILKIWICTVEDKENVIGAEVIIHEDCSPLASADTILSTFAIPLLLVLVELVLLLGEDTDGRLWLRKTPGAMGCGPPGDLTVPVLNSWSVRLPSWESRLCSGELLSWEIFGGLSAMSAFFLVLFFFFLVFCCSSYRYIYIFFDWEVLTGPFCKDTVHWHTWWESFAAAAARPVSMEATRAPSLAGRSCRGTEGPTRAVMTCTSGIGTA